MKTFIFTALAVFGLGQVALALPVSHKTTEFQMNRRPGAPPLLQIGTQLVRNKVQVMRAVYDYSVQGGSSPQSINLTDSDGKAAILPANAIIKQVLVQGKTTLTSAGTTNLVLGASTSNDLKTTAAYTAYTGTALLAGAPIGTAATMLNYSAATTVHATLSGSSLTAGKFNVMIEYYLTD